MSNFWKNSEGFSDKTAGGALTIVRPGEIWDINTAQGARRALILSQSDTVLQVLYLQDELRSGEFVVPVNSYMVDCRFSTFTFTSKLGRYIGRIPAELLDEIQWLVAQSFGFIGKRGVVR